MPTYAIGDIQGCGRQLTDLLAKIRIAAPDADVIFLGDLVNRGPQSLATLRTIKSLGDRARSVLGNHDLHLLAVANGIRKSGKSDTINEILDAPDREELLDWLRYRPMAIREQNYLLVHAGVAPQWSAEKTVALAQEVECALRGDNWVEFLRQMYGNTPTNWDDSLEGPERLRCIVNVLTRIRYCLSDGSMEFTMTGQQATLPGYLPWFDLPQRQSDDVTILFGHWSSLGLMMHANAIGLDTGCLWGGKLTALCLEDRSLIQIDCPETRKHG